MKNRVFTVVFMIMVTAIAATLMTGAKVMLQGRIALNESLLEHRARLYGLGLLSHESQPTAAEVDEIFQQQVKVKKQADQVLYYAYAEDGETLLSVGIEFEGPGYWGPIRGILSMDASQEDIKALYFVAHQETPGLGGRITEPWFLGQFTGKSVSSPDAEGRYLVFVPEDAEATEPNQVNAISGATRTSDSLKRILNQALHDLHDVLNQES